jgi:hypothetical protein
MSHGASAAGGAHRFPSTGGFPRRTGVKTMDKVKVFDAVNEVVSYLWDDEHKHYDEMRENGDDVSDHIWNSVALLSLWLDEQDPDGKARLEKAIPTLDRRGVKRLSVL